MSSIYMYAMKIKKLTAHVKCSGNLGKFTAQINVLHFKNVSLEIITDIEINMIH